MLLSAQLFLAIGFRKLKTKREKENSDNLMNSWVENSEGLLEVNLSAGWFVRRRSVRPVPVHRILKFPIHRMDAFWRRITPDLTDPPYHYISI